MKRTLCLFLALILAVGICFSAPVTITASAAETTIIDEGNCGATGNEENVKWSLDSEGTLTISGSGAMADYNGYDMPWYNYQNYNYQNNITTIVINKGVTTIGEQAFNGCTKLIRVTIPESVTEIGKKAFTGCESLTTVTIPEGVEKIGFYAFFDCTKLTSVTIPKSVTEIGDYAFDACDALTTVNVPCSWKGETAGGKTVTKYHTYENGKCTVANCDNACAHETITDDDVCTTCGGKYCGADKTEDKVVYFFDEGTLTITGKGAMADYTGNDMPWCNDKSAIKRVVIENGVTSIGKYSFYKCTALESVTIGDSVTSIGDYAFKECEKLETVTIGEAVQTIGSYAFDDCSFLTSVTMGDSVTSIGDNAFDGCASLSSVTIGNAVKTIGVSTFKTCGMLQTITIPNSVEEIGNGAFYCCMDLRAVTIPASVRKIGAAAFGACDDLTTVNVPCNWDGSIYSFAESILKFADHDTTKTATCISKAECSVCGKYGDFANHTPAESAIYTDNGDGTHGFECTVCGTVTEAHTPDANGYTVGTDGTHSFKCSGCGMIITEPHNFENAAHQCACDKRETYSITCTETGSKGGAVRLTNTEPAIHGQTYTTQLLMPEGLQGWYTDVIKVSVNGEELVKDTDYTYDLYTVTLTVKGEKVTGNIEITYQINAAVTFVLNGGDLESSLKDRLADGDLYIIDDKITMPLAYGVRSSFNDLNNTFIREGYICTGLKNGEQDADMTAPVVNCTLSVQWQCTHNTIDENDVCTTCGGKYCGADKTKDKVVCFYDEGTATLTITGSGAMATYGFATPAPWNTKKASIENIVIEKGVTNISPYAFGEYSNLKSVIIPDTVTTIGQYAFYGCTELTSVTIPSSVKTIDKCAFFECVSLQTVDLTGVSSIGENAFCCCTALNSVVLGDDLKTIGFGAFVDCNSLETIELPEGLTTIDESAFSGCKKLKKVTIPKSVTKIGVGAFEVCTSLAEVEISEGVTTIGNRAFQFCEALTKIIIPKSVTSIDAEAFFECSNLKYIFFEGTEDSQKTIGDALVTNAQIHYGSSTHTFNENYTVDVEPTCTEKGSESQHCKYCDLTQNERAVKENGHTSVNGGTEKAHTICDVCEEILSAEHEFASKITTEPTYTKEGIKTFTCECGYSYEEVIPCLVPGEIKAEEAESNSFSATVVDINSIVTKLQLTEEEKALIEQGADMKIVFKLSDIGATINTPEKEAIFKALTNEKIAVFLDIQLVKQIANNSVNVQKLNDLIKVTVELPSEFISKDGNVKRSYSVLRYHDGDETKVTTLNAKFDETTGTLTFETDRFSTYAIVYSDVVVSDGEGVPGTPDPGDGEVSTPENPKDETTPGIPENPKDETTPGTPETPKDDVSSDKTDDSVTNDKNDASSETGTNDKNDTSKDDVPKAGVISTTSIWLGAMALSGLGALLVSKKKKEND